MDYKKEMRHLIDIIKQQSFDAPLEQTLDDMKTLTTAVKDLSDRIEMRVRKNVNPSDKAKKAPAKLSKSFAMPKVSLPKPLPTNTRKSQSPISNATSSNAFSANDINNLKKGFVSRQHSIKPVKPEKPI